MLPTEPFCSRAQVSSCADILILPKISFSFFSFGREESWKVEQFLAHFHHPSSPPTHHSNFSLFFIHRVLLLVVLSRVEVKSVPCWTNLLPRWSCSRAFSLLPIEFSPTHSFARAGMEAEKSSNEKTWKMCVDLQALRRRRIFFPFVSTRRLFPIPPSRIFVSFRAAKNRNPLGNGW